MKQFNGEVSCKVDSLFCGECLIFNIFFSFLVHFHCITFTLARYGMKKNIHAV